MPLVIDWGNSIIQVTSPTTEVTGQVLADFIEDQMASPVGLGYPAIINPEGKIEDPTQPGLFSIIIIILNSPWQIQFWGGSGYTKISGAKLVGGLTNQPFKATGTAGDITVLESPIDGTYVTDPTLLGDVSTLTGLMTNPMDWDAPNSRFIIYTDTGKLTVWKYLNVAQSDNTTAATMSGTGPATRVSLTDP